MPEFGTVPARPLHRPYVGVLGSATLPGNEDQFEYAPASGQRRAQHARRAAGVGALLCCSLWCATRTAWWYFERDDGLLLAGIQLAQLSVTIVGVVLGMVWFVMALVTALRPR